MRVTNYVNCLKNMTLYCMDSNLLFEKHETPVKVEGYDNWPR